MRCFLARRYISRYLDGALDPKKKRRLKSHLEKCPACATLLADLKATDVLLRQKKGPEAPQEYWEEFPQRLSRLIQEKGLANVGGLLSRPAWRLGWVAAGCIAALFVLVLISNIALRQEIGEMRNRLEQGLAELRESLRGVEGVPHIKVARKEAQFGQADYLRFARIYSEIGDLFQGQVRWVVENEGKMSMEVGEPRPTGRKAAFMDMLILVGIEAWREEAGGTATLVSAPQIIMPAGQEASLELPSLAAEDPNVYRFSIAPSLTRPGAVSLHLKFEVAEAYLATAEATSFNTHLLLGETRGLEVATLRTAGVSYRLYLSLATQKLTKEEPAGA